MRNQMLSVEDFKRFVDENIEPLRRSYWNDGSDSQVTLRENTEAFSRIRIRPTILRGAEDISTEITVLGESISIPIGISPTAYQQWAHRDGELGSARASSKHRTIMILSCYTNVPMGEVARNAPGTKLWAQVYIYRERAVTLEIVRRAESLGFKAIVVTVDSPVLGNKINDRRRNICLPSEFRLPNYEERYAEAVLGGTNQSIYEFADSLITRNVSWEDFRWICRITSLPVVAKGILTGESARLAIENGASAVFVSNHGGRQLDNVPATIEMLPEVVRAVAGRVEVYIDGGIRLGTDIVKALAIGARAVFIGRPVVWGLAYNGSDGVQQILSILKEELRRDMLLCGAAQLSEIRPSMIMRKNQ